MRVIATVLLLGASALAAPNPVDGVRAPGGAVERPEMTVFRRSNNTTVCRKSEVFKIKAAMADCKKLAEDGKKAAKKGHDGLLKQFFKDDSPSTRIHVADVLEQVLRHCGDESRLPTDSCHGDFCSDHDDASAIDLGVPKIYFCDAFFADDSAGCRDMSRGATVVAQAARAVNKDVRVVTRGYQGSLGLTRSDALANAESYALFATAVSPRCIDESRTFLDKVSGAMTWLFNVKEQYFGVRKIYVPQENEGN
ncbi:hypothetical protein RJ55_02118 [Drechmeria coniospora]|nr:hypothetical protein RJ55_02118 [Drechmeria coniospora]